MFFRLILFNLFPFINLLLLLFKFFLIGLCSFSTLNVPDRLLFFFLCFYFFIYWLFFKLLFIIFLLKLFFLNFSRLLYTFFLLSLNIISLQCLFIWCRLTFLMFLCFFPYLYLFIIILLAYLIIY